MSSFASCMLPIHQPAARLLLPIVREIAVVVAKHARVTVALAVALALDLCIIKSVHNRNREASVHLNIGSRHYPCIILPIKVAPLGTAYLSAHHGGPPQCFEKLRGHALGSPAPFTAHRGLQASMSLSFGEHPDLRL